MIREWIIAAKVLLKYNLTYNPFVFVNKSRYAFNNQTGLHQIEVNPFSKNFLEDVLHEVGHHIYKGLDKRCLSLNTEGLKYNGDNYLLVLEEEAFASKFARRYGKGKIDIKYLCRCFHTYTGAGYVAINRVPLSDKESYRVRYTDLISKLSVKLLGVGYV